MRVKVFYVDNIDSMKDKMLELYLEFYGEVGRMRLEKRYSWYKKHGNYKLLLAEYDGKLVGQASAYQVKCIVKNAPVELWWGVDMFLLEKARGLGIGKKLQNKLHNDCRNFSSVWYSPINGIIKRKCGAKDLLSVKFCYYPISKCYGFFLDRVFGKVFKMKAHVQLPIYDIYSKVNACSAKGYSTEELNFSVSIVNQMNIWLAQSQHDFYVERNWDFIRWKYIDNPNMDYHLLEIKNNDVVCGYLAFTEVYPSCFHGGIANVCRILDFVKSPNTSLNLKNAISIISSYYRGKKKLEGVEALESINYAFKKVESTTLLSTMEEKNINHPYLTYIDQDMEQIF